jgi:hypothetical protein
MSSGPAIFTVLASNYLPKAMTLADSLRRHHPDWQLRVVLIDVASDDRLPDLPDVVPMSTASLGLSEREVLNLATIYGLVEFATAIKPLIFTRLLDDHDEAIYLDPDTYVTAPMAELLPDLAATEGGILLTPHFLEPVGEDAVLPEGHLLNVGVFNLGFCAVDRRARRFLDWWWGHLESECVWDPLSGLFVDQKWVDIGSVLFRAGSWRHYGYNVSFANLHERSVALDPEGYYIEATGDRLRLFHFHAFDPAEPTELYTRRDDSTAHLRQHHPAVDKLCVEYADRLTTFERSLPPAPPYPYAHDTAGRPLSRQLRRAYRLQLAAAGGDRRLPSPFVAAEAGEFDRWRRRARSTEAREIAVDAAKAVRLMFPEEYERIKGRFPRLVRGLRSRFFRTSGMWV